jgi:hypothetical protein
MCSLDGTCTECETCETIPNHLGLSSTILAHLGGKCVPWVSYAPNVRHMRPSLNYPDHPRLIRPPLVANVFLGGTCNECETETTPQPSWTVLNYPGPPWCKCVPWMVHAPNVTCETIPTIQDCPQLSWPTLCKCSLGRYTCTECETCETIPNYPDCSNYPGPPWCKCVPWVVQGTKCETCETIPNPSWTILDYPGPPL